MWVHDQMSKVSTVYSRIVEVLAELYPQHTRIPNPYSIPDNNNNFLKKGYGLKVGDSSFVPFEFCDWMTGRVFSVVFTREIVRLDSDAEKYDDMTPLFLEDVYKVQERFFNYNELGIEAEIAQVELGSVTGLEAFSNGKNNFYQMEASFTFSIKESFV